MDCGHPAIIGNPYIDRYNSLLFNGEMTLFLWGNNRKGFDHGTDGCPTSIPPSVAIHHDSAAPNDVEALVATAQ